MGVAPCPLTSASSFLSALEFALGYQKGGAFTSGTVSSGPRGLWCPNAPLFVPGIEDDSFGLNWLSESRW